MTQTDRSKKSAPSRFVLTATLGVMGAACLGPAAFASGFALREGAADWLGNAFAGETAKAYDASTAWTNPAGMVRLDQDEIDGSVSYIAPDAHFSGSNTDPFTGGNVSGTTGGNIVQAAASGGLFGVWDASPDLRLGFGVTAPFGERVSYPQNFVGRYQSLVSSVSDIDLGLAFAYKVTDQFSIGGGPNIDYFAPRLTQALNIPGLSAATGQDPISDLHGNSWGVGYNLGMMYQFDDATRIGIDYRSRIRHNITGADTISVPASYYEIDPPAAAGLSAAGTGATTSITLPDSLSLGAYRQLTPQWAIMADVDWTDWSLFNKLDVTATNGSGAVVIPEHWRNTWYAGAGANYQALDNLLLQTGFAYDESPVDNSNRTTRVPDSNHYILSAGVQYQVLKSTSLQVAYAHIFTPGGTIDNSAPAPVGLAGVLSGSYDESANSVTAGVTVKF